MQFISPNELLTALPPVIYERLGPHLQRVRLEAGRILFDVGATIDYTWFIKRGIVSLLLDTENGDSVEVAMAGPDSVIGFLETVTTNEALFRAQVQIAGEALRISARDLQAAIKRESQIYLPVLRQNLVTIDIVDFLRPSATLYRYEGITILAVLLFQSNTQRAMQFGS
jgi:CRP-like cAMP-binding protein